MMQPNFKVRIPEPCHEDWGKMTPSEKGRFCQSCSKVVRDFRDESPEEIRDFLLKKQSEGKKTCGRFNSSQVELPDLIQQRNEKQFSRKWRSYFAAACILAFGTMLFSGCSDVKADQYLISDSDQHPTAIGEPIPVIEDSAQLGDTIILPEGDEILETVINGNVSLPIPPPPPLKGDVEVIVVGEIVPVRQPDPFPEIVETMGDVDIEYTEPEVPNVCEGKEDPPPPPPPKDYPIMGIMMAPEDVSADD